MLEVNGLKISVSRGDTGSVTVHFTGEDIPPDGTVAMVTLQKTLDSGEPLWAKKIPVTDGAVGIPFYTQDTNYTRGAYLWCLRLLYENGDVYTPMKRPQDFEILPANGEVGETDGE